MKGKILIVLFFVFSFNFCEGQSWIWGKEPLDKTSGWGDPILGQSVGVDDSGNAYLTGEFHGNLTFGTYFLNTSSQGVYIAKYDRNENILWAKQCIQASGKSTCQRPSVAVDLHGYTYLAAAFHDTIKLYI